MKIALVAHHARPTGGQDRYLLELARQLAPRHDVHLVVVRAEGTEGSKITVHELGLPDRPVLALSPRFVKHAKPVIESGAFDIVHGIGGSFPGANVVTVQYCHLAWGEAQQRYRIHEGSLVDRIYHGMAQRQAVDYERRAYASPALREVIAVSRETAGEVRRFHRVGEERVTVVHNGSDPSVFDRARYPDARASLRRELGVADDTVIALLIGTYARKGLDTATLAVARASPSLHLAVAGSGDTAEAKRRAANSGLGNRLHLLGSRRDVAQLYAGADIFILPTRYEPFGMVIAEAMQAELPVVVSRCAGAAELIAPGVSGFVVDAADDVEGFASHLRALAGDGALRQSVGRSARAAAMSVAWPEVAARTETVYRRALGRLA